MVASTVTTAQANKAAVKRAMDKRRRAENARPMKPMHLFVVDTSAATIATTSLDDINDRVTFFQFPDHCYLWDSSFTVTDMDSVSSLQFDIVADDDKAGTNAITLVSASTVGQTGGKAQQASTVQKGVDVSNKYVSFKTTAAAATPVAGTVFGSFLITLDKVSGF